MASLKIMIWGISHLPVTFLSVKLLADHQIDTFWLENSKLLEYGVCLKMATFHDIVYTFTINMSLQQQQN